MPLDLARIQAVFLSAVECHEPAARAALLDHECGPDANLRQRVEELLNASDESHSLLDRPIVGRAKSGSASTAHHQANWLEVAESHSPGIASDEFRPATDPGPLPAAGRSGGVSDDDPSKIGRYLVINRLGQGEYGRVYLARDDDLDRHVAIKVPTPERIRNSEDLEAFLIEARILARLDHPNIVPVFDVGRTDDGICFVVSKLVDGSDLAVRIEHARPSFRDSAELVAAVADALHYAHDRGLVHRDIKPANILLDLSGKPCVTDFGLALADEDFGQSGVIAGTPAYMSPEQARGEGHRVDRRSDIFSLGVVLYELLTGMKPFQGDSLVEIVQQIISSEPRPPRQVDDAVPREMERICLKALSKRASERYATAQDLAEELRLFLQITEGAVSPRGPSLTTSAPTRSDHESAPLPAAAGGHEADQRPLPIVPKGLRSFDEHDANFFLELIPGPRDREGLPDTIQFWKRAIEQLDPDLTFKVGLIYGPSGCGKSSLVKAGLLPRLGKHVVPVYIEATPDETEARLLRVVRKACPQLSDRSGLADSLASLRRGRALPPGRKLLLVLDQFEQWLSVKRDENTELVAALRQCDGERLQAVVMVRDDFWMAATRFMRDLEIRLVEGENSGAVDLFDLDHARKVLVAFGRAFGRLSENALGRTRDQMDFVRESVNGLAEEGAVIPVRLALFAEMMKSKSWNRSTLREVGGTKGVGVAFLEETFSASTAPPEHRLHRQAAQAVLKTLLPETGADFKGQMRSRQELLVASGYANRGSEFDKLIHVLDQELRLITPTDPEGHARAPDSDRFYQLSHDYLVHSLREWLSREQRSTRRGRVELRLARRASIWNAISEHRNLPTFSEWVEIQMLSRRRAWTEPERRMMKEAGRIHGRRALGVALSGCLITWAVLEGYGALRASALVESLQTARTSDVAPIIEQLSGYRPWARPRLVRVLERHDVQSREHLHASLALLTVDPTQLHYLFKRLLSATPVEFPVLRDALSTHRSTLTGQLWTELETAKPGDASVLPCAGALASYDPDDARWEAQSDKVAHSLVSVNAILVGPWIEALRPVRGKLSPAITVVFKDSERSDTEHTLATDILADFAADDPARLAELLMVADTKAFLTIFPIAARQATKLLPVLRAELSKAISYSWNDPPLNPRKTKPHPELARRFEQAQGMVADHFAFCQYMPLDEFLTNSEALRDSGYRPVRLRPHVGGAAVCTAAIWTRDERNWRVSSGLTAEEIWRQDEKNRKDGFIPVDVAGYVAIEKDGTAVDRHVALWVEKPGDDDAQLYVGITTDLVTEAEDRFREVRLVPRAVQAVVAADGSTRYCGVWGRPAGLNITGQTYRDLLEKEFGQKRADLSDQSLIDMAISRAPAPRVVPDKSAVGEGTTAGRPDRRYSAVWSNDWRFESVLIDGTDPVEHLRKCREKLDNGYRPVAWASSQLTTDLPPMTASVWHRPVITDGERDRLAERQARAAVAVARLALPAEITPLLRHSPDPRVRSFLVNRLFPLGADFQSIISELDRLDPSVPLASAPGQQWMDAVLFHPETSQRRALILLLGTHQMAGLSPGQRQQRIGKLLDRYRNDPDAGIHAAAEWTLRRWNQHEELLKLDAELMKISQSGERRWYINKQGQTFAVIEGPVEFRMGAPPTETERIPGNEPLVRARIPRQFAIAAKEVSVKQFQRFLKQGGAAVERYQASASFLARYTPDPDGPWVNPDWYAAAHFCNWLSDQEGLPRDQWCYLPNKAGAYAEGMSCPANVLERTGYRLPTEAEWEYACRAGAVASRYYGHSIDLLAAHAQYQANSKEHAWACGSLFPNDLGLFDMLGNVIEWCQDNSNAPKAENEGMYNDILNNAELIVEKNPRILRGGTFVNRPAIVRSAYRLWDAPSGRYTLSGFRPARTHR